jgi:hypothetical protein
MYDIRRHRLSSAALTRTEHFSQATSQKYEHNQLLQISNARIENPVGHDHVLGVTGHIWHFHLRAHRCKQVPASRVVAPNPMLRETTTRLQSSGGKLMIGDQVGPPRPLVFASQHFRVARGRTSRTLASQPQRAARRRSRL